MNLAFFLRQARRESRGSRGRLLFVIASLAVGVAATVGVAALIGAIRQGMQSESRELLAADLAIESQRELPPEVEAAARKEEGVREARLRQMTTLARDGEGRSRLVELNVVEGPYPLYGEILTDPPAFPVSGLGPEDLAASVDLLEAMGLAPGDSLGLGGVEFRIRAAVRGAPDRFDFAAVLGPKVFISSAGFARTVLGGVGNRVRHRALFAFPSNPSRAGLDRRIQELRDEIPGSEYLRFESHYEAQPAVRRSLERIEDWLGLTALLSLILGGVGVAEIVRSWLAGRVGAIAILRSLGMRPFEVLILHLGQVLLMALAGSLVGALAGSLLPHLVARLEPRFLAAGAATLWQPLAILRGLLLGVLVALAFACLPLSAVWRVPPALVFRSGAAPLAPPRLLRVLVIALLILGILGAARIQTDSWTLAASFSGGMAVVLLVLGAAAAAIRRLARRLPRGALGPRLGHGLAALGRPGAGTTSAIVALGLGFMVVITMGLVSRRLESRLREALPEDAPSAFFVDVQVDQWDGLESLLRGAGAQRVESVPVLMARLEAVDGVSVRELAEKRRHGGGRKWVLTREQRITWRDGLPASNRLVRGSLWSDPEHAEVSLEKGFAEDLGVDLGATLTFDVQGVSMDFVVTSLRKVEWESFGINFFVMAEPGTLDDAPHFRLAVARLEPSAELGLQDQVAAAYPNVTMLRVRPLLDRLAGVLRRFADGLRILGGFTILAGIAILAGAVAATAARRSRESALLLTLGIRRREIVSLYSVEYALAGLVAGLLGAAAALLLSAWFVQQVLDLDPGFSPWVLPGAAAAGAVLTVICGLLASLRALNAKPIETLRG